jgi:acyl-CoA reductase-like NAD-dependent aldehyde dehydrogenase
MERHQIKDALRSIVARCHVADSQEEVASYVVSRFKKAQWKAKPESEKESILRAAEELHEENRGLYRQIMTGNL